MAILPAAVVPVARPPLAGGSPPCCRVLGFSQSGALSGLSLSLPAATASPTPASSSSLPLVYCGRGDRKTAKGKRFSHSFGNARPRNKNKGSGPPRVAAPPAPQKKDKFDDGEIVKIVIDESLR
ncbi:plastid-specific ribosomal protein 4 [Wolffia australiana]